MPELPDVEAFRRVLAEEARNRLIRRVDVRDPGVLNDVTPRRFRSALEGRRFTAPERHGKLLLARTGGPVMLVHFGMTGEMVAGTQDGELAPHDRVVFTLGAGRRLVYRDQRKLKGLWLLDEEETGLVLADQGPDAARAGPSELDVALEGRGGVKAALMDQRRLAGIGNLLADEILWGARLHPRRSVASLAEADRGALYTSLRDTVRRAVRAGRVPPRASWLTGHRDRSGARCPRCDTLLEHERVAGRGTVLCPRCQPAPR